MENKIWKKYEDIDAAIYEKEQQINKIHLNWDKLVNNNSEEKVSQILDKLQEEKEELIRCACNFLSNRNTTLMREGTKAKKGIKEQQRIATGEVNKPEEVKVENKPEIVEKQEVPVQPEVKSVEQPEVVEQKEEPKLEQINNKEKQKQLLKKEQLLLEIKRKILAKEISLGEASRLVQKVASVYGTSEEKGQQKGMRKVA